jgi:hypothetical protein
LRDPELGRNGAELDLNRRDSEIARIDRCHRGQERQRQQKKRRSQKHKHRRFSLRHSLASIGPRGGICAVCLRKQPSGFVPRARRRWRIRLSKFQACGDSAPRAARNPTTLWGGRGPKKALCSNSSMSHLGQKQTFPSSAQCPLSANSRHRRTYSITSSAPSYQGRRHGTVSKFRNLWLLSQFRAGCDARSRGQHHVAKLDPVGRKHGAHSIAVVIDNKDRSTA